MIFRNKISSNDTPMEATFLLWLHMLAWHGMAQCSPSVRTSRCLGRSRTDWVWVRYIKFDSYFYDVLFIHDAMYWCLLNERAGAQSCCVFKTVYRLEELTCIRVNWSGWRSLVFYPWIPWFNQIMVSYSCMPHTFNAADALKSYRGRAFVCGQL